MCQIDIDLRVLEILFDLILQILVVDKDKNIYQGDRETEAHKRSRKETFLIYHSM